MPKKTIPPEFKRQLKDLEADAQEQQKAPAFSTYVKPTDSDTRQKIANRFVMFYFGLLTLVIFGVPIFNLIAYHITKDTKALQIQLSDIIQTYSAVVGPTLGFVVAYYFKSKNDA